MSPSFIEEADAKLNRVLTLLETIRDTKNVEGIETAIRLIEDVEYGVAHS